MAHFLTNLKIVNLEYVQSLVEIGRVVLEKIFLKFRQCFFAIS